MELNRVGYIGVTIVFFSLLCFYGESFVQFLEELHTDVLSSLSDLWEDPLDDELAGEDELPIYLVSEYVDLLPAFQFTLLKLFVANLERNESNWLLDDYIG